MSKPQIEKEKKEDDIVDDVLERVYMENREESIQHFNIIAFIGTITIIGILLVITTRPDTSEIERRSLTKFPEFNLDSFFSGEYTKQINAFFSDTVPLRETLVELSSDIKSLMGVSFGDVKLHGIVLNDNNLNSDSHVDPAENGKTSFKEQQNKDLQANSESPPVTSVITTETSEVTSTAAQTTINASTGVTIPETAGELIPGVNTDSEDGIADIINNGILVYKNRGLMLYGGNKQQGERYAAAINSYKEHLGDSVNVYSMIIPTAVEFYCPASYRSLSGNQRDDINYISSFLASNIIAVNVYSTLLEHKDEEIYLRTDHHWGALGAYYAAQEFCTAANVPYTGISEYEQVIISDYVGTLYSYSGDIGLKNNPENFIYYKPPGNYTTTYFNYESPLIPFESSLFISQPTSMSYCIFMGGDSKVTRVKTDAGIGRKVAVFKDSYGNALIPFLVNSFDEIHVIDIRYFPHNAINYLKEHEITDVLFANNAFAANTSTLISCIETIMLQDDYSGG